MILGCEKDKHLIGKDETMKDYLPEQIIDIIRSSDLESVIELDKDIRKTTVYITLEKSQISFDNLVELFVNSVNCIRQIELALKGAGYEL